MWPGLVLKWAWPGLVLWWAWPGLVLKWVWPGLVLWWAWPGLVLWWAWPGPTVVGMAWSGTQVGVAWFGTEVGVAWSGTVVGVAWPGTEVGVAWSGTVVGVAWPGTEVGVAWSGTVVGVAWSGTEVGVAWFGTEVHAWPQVCIAQPVVRSTHLQDLVLLHRSQRSFACGTCPIKRSFGATCVSVHMCVHGCRTCSLTTTHSTKMAAIPSGSSSSRYPSRPRNSHEETIEELKRRHKVCQSHVTNQGSHV